MLMILSSQGKFHTKNQIIVSLILFLLACCTAYFSGTVGVQDLFDEFTLEVIWLVICI